MNKRQVLLVLSAVWILLLIAPISSGQADTEKPVQTEIPDQYYLGTEEGLEITVHIWGEVVKPGLYKVRDTTNLLELISLAGGPTEYANLEKIRMTRARKRSPRFLIIDLDRYLDEEDHDAALPVLRPGDTIRITRNSWYTWRTAVRIASELAIIANVYVWIQRLSE